MKNYNTLILSGGGIRGFGLLGSLQFLLLNNYLHNIRKFIGTSIGAIVAVFIIVGYDPTEIIIIFIQRNYFNQLGSYSLIQAIKGNGFLSFEEILDFKSSINSCLLIPSTEIF